MSPGSIDVLQKPTLLRNHYYLTLFHTHADETKVMRKPVGLYTQ